MRPSRAHASKYRQNILWNKRAKASAYRLTSDSGSEVSVRVKIELSDWFFDVETVGISDGHSNQHDCHAYRANQASDVE